MSDVLCLSHVRWSAPAERPRQLMTRLAAHRPVFYFEEPIYGRGPDRLEIRNAAQGVVVLVPWLSSASRGDPARAAAAQRRLLHSFLSPRRLSDAVLWYCTPRALSFTAGLRSRLVVYDCMRAQRPEALDSAVEAELLRRAHLVLAETPELYGSQRSRHARVHLCPSGVDFEHFARARQARAQPGDLASIPKPRVGYAGTIDARVDLALVAELARRRPELQLVMIGPLARESAQLPSAPNLHWLGKKAYAELPAYLSSWESAMIPFAEAVKGRDAGLGKALEYLAAGLRVVSTLPHPKLAPFAKRELLRVARGAEPFARALDAAIFERSSDAALASASGLLAARSWQRAAEHVRGLLDAALQTAASDAPRV